MRKKIIISTILLVTFNFIYSQVPVGLKYDCNGYALNGYFDPLTYSPEKKLTKIHNSDSYEIGYYYDSFNNKVEGLIKFENDKIFFKKVGNEIRDRINPGEINYFVIGVDSFFVISNFYYKNRIKTEPEFVQYITKFDGYTFIKHYNFTSGIAQQYAMQPPIVETFLVKSKENSTWENFPDNKRFKESALKYFSHIPYLKEKIELGHYSSEDMLSIIKMAEYYSKYQKSEPIYYDEYWQEIRDDKKAKYFAKIVDMQDSIWTFEYFEDTTKLYLAKYSSFYPNTKNGEFISYYKDGNIRQSILYENNKPKEVKTFYKSNQLNSHYKYIETKNKNTGKIDIDIKYECFMDSLGNKINIYGDNLIHNVFDDFNNATYTNVFKDGELISSYKLIGKDTVFQITNPDYDFKIKQLQKKFEYHLSGENYDKALSMNAQGIILISLIIDKKGSVISCFALNHIHPEIDQLVDNFIKNILLPRGEFRYKLKPYKVNKTKQFCETVIPIEFSINRFYRQPVNYNHFNHFNQMNWQTQQMIQNQMRMNYYKPPVTPMMPGRF